MNIDTKKLDELLRQRIQYKREEDAAAAKRKAADSDIAAMLKPGLGKDYGTVSCKLEDAGIKVGVVFGYSRAVDVDAFNKAFDTLPATVRETVKWKPEVVAAKWDALSDVDRVLASRFVTTKPASPSIKIEVL